MKTKKILSVLAACVIFAGCSIKQVNNDKRTVSVSGSGTVEVDADSATVILSVITRGKEVAAAAAENSLKMKNVRDAIIESGIAKDNISTEKYSVTQENNYINGKSIPGDYKVQNRIKIFIKDLTLVSEVIDKALKNGANELTSFSYGISNKEIYVKQARTMAVQNAMESANLIASTGGAALGKLLTVYEHQNNYTGKMMVASARAAEAVNEEDSAMISTPLSSGKSKITINIDATFELK